VPVAVRYGCSFNTTLALLADEVAVRISRCLPVRYSAAVTPTRSGSGLTVTVVVTAAEVSGAVFVALMVRVITVGATWPTGSTGALKETFAVVGPVGVTVSPIRAGAPAWVTVKVRGVSAGTLGSDPLIAKVRLSAPENTEIGATALAVGARAAFTVTEEFEVELPQLFEAVSERFTTVCAATTGAVYVALAELSGAMLPEAGGAQLNVMGAVPLELPERAMDPPEATVYGPPAFATGATQAGPAGLMVTVVETGAEAIPAAFVAVTVTVMSVAASTPDGAV
jgi:hypothetical protein